MGVKTKQSNPGWLKKLRKQLKKSEAELAVGIPKDTEAASLSYPDGTRLLDVAVANEYGTEDIPPRPAIALSSEKLTEAFQVASEQWRIGHSIELLEKFSPVAIGIVQQSITELRDPPNAESTIKKKKSSNPLIDTGLYRQSISASVRSKD